MEEFDDEKVLFNSKQSGFKRLNPQVEPEKMPSRIEYACVECDFMSESIKLFDVHVKKHQENQSKHKCKECDLGFATVVHLKNHKRNHHQDKTEKINQYNCEDCAFQGENGVELKNHIQRTKHTPSEFKEECYTCKKEFTSYWLLMNHRKTEHPSNKKCRYFQIDQCRFNAESCWYKHITEEEKESDQSQEKCNQCELYFKTKSDLMKHKKSIHSEKVTTCRNYRQGVCNNGDDNCWFSHERQTKEKDAMNEESQENENEQVFQKVQEKTPPDQISILLDMIKKISIQVERLERTQGN